MRWASSVLAGALLIGVTVQPARAQEEQEECVCPSPWGRVMVWPFGQDWTTVIWSGQRARLGVYVHGQANPETDSIGALIDAVAEGGPAEAAGIREGDIITKLDGESLLRGTEEYGEDESAPGARLIERARKLEVGDTVEVEFRRGRETKTVQVVAGEFEGPWISIRGPLERESRRLRELAERYRQLPELQYIGPESFALRVGARLPGLELVSLNPDLGEYFGADEGVLVVSVPEDSELGLRAGDVILAIDGREVKSPSHAMRILRSYNADEEVSFRIVRQKSERTVEGKVPEALDFRSRVLRIERR